ncbi:PREDICTED: uncharacterized protein LOC104799912 isoform X2 [Tarenaya hassleriana]|uniref:uncharacterized protein LOC104799912 isoform X1 n=1 Tax=Tarenaya hassleriana TaxID=28532 RepID=UPI00053C1EFF|nr:PREDICTED: uncharacterized protein LOC104799912 isoform X1 [Tarenaya hassleriana]XP_010520899.1 PREDICTED: uncharacterized protein LOC104799912 isoform X2 [Tarenaya hassleriana]
MAISKPYPLLIFLLAMASRFLEAKAGGVFCSNPYERCYQKYIDCPDECPTTGATNSKNKVCYVDCDYPLCNSQCRFRQPNCYHPGSACHDPRFIGGDGIIFYFHGKSNEHFSLVSDSHLQINARFTGHRPAGRARDFTWIQALGILFGSHEFSLEAAKTATWDSNFEHLKLVYDGRDLDLPGGTLSTWYSPDKAIKAERVAERNSVTVMIKDKAEIMVKVVPVTKEDDRIHGYRVPADDCFAHFEVQFRFFKLSPEVDGVLGRTYRPDFKNPAKPGVAMPVLGGEDSFRTSSLLSTDCKTCLFSGPMASSGGIIKSGIGYGTLDCTRGASSGYGIICRR